MDKRFTRISWNEKDVVLEWTTKEGADRRAVDDRGDLWDSTDDADEEDEEEARV